MNKREARKVLIEYKYPSDIIDDVINRFDSYNLKEMKDYILKNYYPCENCATCGGMRGLGPECAYWSK